MKHIVPVSFLMVGLVLLVGACSDDDPVTPPGPPTTPSSPDALMFLYRQALESMDNDLYESLLHKNFGLYPGPETHADFGLEPGSGDLNREETVRSGTNMFSGQAVTNWTGAAEPGVSRVIVLKWDQMTEWETLMYGPNEVPRSKISRWEISLAVDRENGSRVRTVEGIYEIRATKVDSTDSYLLHFILPRGGSKAEDVPDLAGLHLHYLTNEAPTATFETTEWPWIPWSTFSFDASASSDPDGGLANFGFRWQLGEGTEWTNWYASRIQYVFESEGPHQVTLEVRDRWGATARAVQTVNPVRRWLPFPDSPDRLMANFQRAYETMNFEELERIIHPDFLMILQQETVDRFPDLGATIDYNEELRIGLRMFSGEDLTDPQTGALIPGMESTAFRVFDPWDAWQASSPEDFFPNALFAPYGVDLMFSRGQQYTALKAEGQIRFYVTSRDSLHEGTIQPYFQMIGQADLTGGFKAVEEINFGSIKAIYR